MRKLVLAAMLFGLFAAAPRPAAADIHAIVEYSRSFRNMTRNSTEELWAAADKTLWKTDAILWITRKDLGFLWGVFRRDNTYMEDKLAASPKPAAAPADDIHTKGNDFGLGRVDWKIEPTGESKDIAGIACEHVVARGRSDVSEITVHLWLAPASTPGGAEILRLISDPIRSDERRAAIADLLDTLGGRLPLDREESIDGPIATVMTYRVKVTKLETAAAPAGTYDLPAGAKKQDPKAPPAPRPARKAFELPAAAAVELKRLEETYRVLDFAAGKVWTGWTNYKDFPSQFGFENGMKVLVGHPNPPQGFELLPGLTIAGRKVHVDRRQMSGLELKQPLSCGGGIGMLGEAGGQPVTIVDMKFTRVSNDPAMKDKPFRAETTILILVHELFHCFQSEAIQIAYGNLMYNADADYALYSAIEGLSLDAAYREPDAEKARAILKDFLIARDLKRKSMTGQQAKEESSDDVREGTAVYSEVRTLEVLREGFKAGLSAADDPQYGGFRDIDGLLKTYTDRLKASAGDIYDTKGKCYTYGSYQALLLQRLYPGWQEPFAREPRLLDEELGRRIPLTKEDRAGAEKRFKSVYGLDALRAKAGKAMAERDAAFKALTGTKGLTYVINFKEIGQYTGSLIQNKKNYNLGLMYAYPEEVGRIAFDDVEIEVRHKPILIDKIYHLIMVDPEAAKRAKPYEVTFEKQEGADTFLNAVVTTPLFTLKAPKVRIVSDASRVKIWILARVKG
jgi:hypothetical protein